MKSKGYLRKFATIERFQGKMEEEEEREEFHERKRISKDLEWKMKASSGPKIAR